MSGLRIVHAIGDLDPAGGGPPIVAARLAAAQAKQDCKVTIVSYRTVEGGHRADGLMADTPYGELVDRVSIQAPSGVERLTGRQAARAFERLVDEGVDILHTHGMWEPMMPATSAVARRRGVPYVVTPHGMLDPYTLSVKPTKKRIALSTTHRAFLRKAAFIHMLNADEASLAEPVTGQTSTRVIPNGIFLEEIERLPPKGTFRAAHPQIGDRPYVLFLSRLAHKKGLDYLADAFALLYKRMPGVELVVAGPDDGQKAVFESAIAAHGVSKGVHIVGPLYGDDKLAVLRDATVFCLPSRQEGFSIAITEAMAIGLPVVVSRACHFPEITEVNAGVETELDPAEIAQALEDILSNPQRASDMGAAGAALVRTRFTWPSVARLTIEYYQSVLPGAQN